MSSSIPVDAVAGRAFLARGPLFVCALSPPDAGDARRAAWLAYAFGDEATFADALEFARNAGGRLPALVVERIAAGTDEWPAHEPTPLDDYVLVRGGFVALVPSIDARVHMPPARPHHPVQLVAAASDEGEALARDALVQLGTCGIVACVRAVLLGDSGAEVDAVIGTPGRLDAGWFAQPARAEVAAPVEPAPVVAAEAEAPRPTDPRALRNAALAVFLAPYPSAPRLEAWLRACPAETDTAAVQRDLEALVATATDALWAEDPVVWENGFEARFLANLTARHAWLAPAGHAPLLAFARWLCWHEGLSR
jgi:hypothetical protein